MSEKRTIPTQIRMDEVSQEYRDFVDKFKPKKTTDDCYTPVEVYEAIAGWVAEEYGLNRLDFVRPFYPGGDYERYQYGEAAIVVDNPPFSILTSIVDFYERHKIPYFLFAPYLTVLGIRPATCRIVTDQDIKYANGATVNTSFVTNLEPTLIRTAPELARRIDEVQMAQRPPEKPKYSYPDDVLTSTAVGYIGRFGIDYKVMREDAYFIRSMDSQRPLGKAIFGGGYLLSKRAAAERAAAEREQAQQEAAKEFTFRLSPREREIQDQLGGTEDGRRIQADFEHDGREDPQ